MTGIFRFLLLVNCLVFLVSCEQSNLDRPNFIIIIADDLGWNDLGVYGNSSIKTPNIDQLAASGIRFDNAFLTTSSCSASRASILTGKYPHSNHVMHLDQPLPASQATVARRLKENGYYTASVGKWHLGPYATKDFDSIIEEASNTSGMQNWVKQIKKRPRRKPFFFWLASYDPHPPYEQADDTLPPAYNPDEIVIPDGFVDGPGTRKEFADYYREISRFDQYTGEVVNELRRQKILENTLIIVMSDNGRAFHRNKLYLYDAGIKTPFILHWPKKIPSPVVNTSLISTVDITPTLLQLAGIPVTPDIQGSPIPAFFGDYSHQGHEYVFAERNWHVLNAHERAVRSRNFLYKENQFPEHGDCVQSQFAHTASFQELRSYYLSGNASPELIDCFSEKRAKQELFRIENSRVIFRNLIDDPTYHDIRLEHQDALKKWRISTRDKDFIPYNP